MPKPTRSAAPAPAAPAATAPVRAGLVPALPAAAAASPAALDCRATPDALAYADGLTLRAAPVALASLDEKARSVTATIATESPVEVYDWQRDEIVREVLLMSGAEIPASRQVPMLDAHDRWGGCKAVIGSTRDLRVEAGAMVGRNVYAETPEADKVWQLVRGGHLTDNSVGYRVLSATIIEPGQSATIDGRTFSAPANQALRIATAWRLAENSNCPIGADPLAKMRAASACPASSGVSAAGHSCPAPAAPPPSAPPTTPTQGSRAMETPAATPAPVIDTEARAQVEQLRQELATSKRIEAVRAECARHGLPQDQIERLVTDNATLEVARGACLDHLRAARPLPGAPHFIAGDASITREHLCAALTLRTGRRDLAEKAYGAKVCEVAEAKVRDRSLLDICRHALHLAGHDVHGLDREDLIRAGFSTGTMPYILGSSANKFLQQGFGDASAKWRQICKTISVPDFKGMELLRMQDAGDLEEVPGAGEVPYASRSEDREQLKAKTYARNFSVTRQDIINDDLSVLSDIPRLHGIRCAKTLAKLIWTHIMSNPTMNDAIAFFQAAAHLNLNTSCALSADNLATAIKGFRNQTDANGDPIDVEPALLVVPPTLEELAKQLCFSNIILPYGGTSGTTRRPQQNVWAGTLTPVVEPRLENANYTGYATDAWYLFARPEELAAVIVGFLNGQENPTLERFDMGADRFGVTFRVSIDAGVRVAEYRAASKQTA
jgi:hypothetical protein